MAAGAGEKPRPERVFFTFDEPHSDIEIEFKDPYRSRFLSKGLEPEENERIRIVDPSHTPEIVREGILLLDIYELIRKVRDGCIILSYFEIKKFVFDRFPEGKNDFRNPFLIWLCPDPFDEEHKDVSELITNEDHECLRIICDKIPSLPGCELRKDITPLHIICMREQPSPRRVLDFAIDNKRFDLLRWVSPMITLHKREIIPMIIRVNTIPDNREMVEWFLIQPWMDMIDAANDFIARMHENHNRFLHKLSYEREILLSLPINEYVRMILEVPIEEEEED